MQFINGVYIILKYVFRYGHSNQRREASYINAQIRENVVAN